MCDGVAVDESPEAEVGGRGSQTWPTDVVFFNGVSNCVVLLTQVAAVLASGHCQGGSFRDVQEKGRGAVFSPILPTGTGSKVRHAVSARTMRCRAFCSIGVTVQRGRSPLKVTQSLVSGHCDVTAYVRNRGGIVPMVSAAG